jgi:hypothetical protein
MSNKKEKKRGEPREEISGMKCCFQKNSSKCCFSLFWHLNWDITGDIY